MQKKQKKERLHHRSRNKARKQNCITRFPALPDADPALCSHPAGLGLPQRANAEALAHFTSGQPVAFLAEGGSVPVEPHEATEAKIGHQQPEEKQQHHSSAAEAKLSCFLFGINGRWKVGMRDFSILARQAMMIGGCMRKKYCGCGNVCLSGLAYFAHIKCRWLRSTLRNWPFLVGAKIAALL